MRDYIVQPLPDDRPMGITTTLGIAVFDKVRKLVPPYFQRSIPKHTIGLQLSAGRIA
jgi:hypothetical protein